MERICPVAADVCNCPQSDLVRGLIPEEAKPPSNVCVKLRTIGSRVRSVTWRHVHHVLCDEVDKELFAVARRKVVNREMDPHGCPGSVGARKPNPSFYNERGKA